MELEARGQQNASINKSNRDFDPEVNIDLLTTIFGIYQKYLLQKKSCSSHIKEKNTLKNPNFLLHHYDLNYKETKEQKLLLEGPDAQG